jgi:hypothetical protein
MEGHFAVNYLPILWHVNNAGDKNGLYGCRKRLFALSGLIFAAIQHFMIEKHSGH